MDKLFQIKTLAATPNPQQVVYAALHQDYSPDFVGVAELPDETTCGEIAIKSLLSGDRGHYGPLEHPQITLACGYINHGTVQQLTRHRLVSFDVQSFRYTGSQVVKVAQEKRDVESVFYLRPVGEYSDRQGKRYEYTEAERSDDINSIIELAGTYAQSLSYGMAEEHARSLLPFDCRQHFVLSCNARSLMHLLDLRWKKDAQLECQWFCDLLFVRFAEWMPQIAEWYKSSRAKKGKLAP